GIVYPRQKAPLLFLLPHFEPDLDQEGPVLDDEFLDQRGVFEKTLMLFGRAEAHDVVDPGVVVTTAIGNHHLTAGPEPLQVAPAGTRSRWRWPYICVFSRSEGAGRATTRKTRGLTRSVIALMTPPLPAASRPSKTITIRSPLALTQSCRWQSSTCSLRSSFS